MFCRKCGKKLPDDSIFCDGCGEKIIFDSDKEENSKKEKKESEHTNENTVANNKKTQPIKSEIPPMNDNALSFKICGNTMNFSSNMLEYGKINKRFFGEAHKQRDKMMKFCNENLHNMGDIFSKGIDKMVDLIDDSMDLGYYVLGDYGIHDYMPIYLHDVAGELIYPTKEINELMKLGGEISKNLHEIADRRMQQCARKVKWLGGGSGLSGAIKGALISGSLNVLSDVAAGIRKDYYDKKDQKMLDDITDKTLIEASIYMADAVEHYYANMRFIVEDILVYHKKLGSIDFNTRNIEDLLEVIGKPTGDKVYRAIGLLCDGIRINPFNEDYYASIYALAEMYTDKKTVIEMVNYWGLNYVFSNHRNIVDKKEFDDLVRASEKTPREVEGKIKNLSILHKDNPSISVEREITRLQELLKKLIAQEEAKKLLEERIRFIKLDIDTVKRAIQEDENYSLVDKCIEKGNYRELVSLATSGNAYAQERLTNTVIREFDKRAANSKEEYGRVAPGIIYNVIQDFGISTMDDPFGSYLCRLLYLKFYFCDKLGPQKDIKNKDMRFKKYVKRYEDAKYRILSMFGSKQVKDEFGLLEKFQPEELESYKVDLLYDMHRGASKLLFDNDDDPNIKYVAYVIQRAIMKNFDVSKDERTFSKLSIPKKHIEFIDNMIQYPYLEKKITDPLVIYKGLSANEAIEKIILEYLTSKSIESEVSPEMIEFLQVPSDEKILFGYDRTLFSKGKNSLIITVEGIYDRRNEKQSVRFFDWADLSNYERVYAKNDNVYVDEIRLFDNYCKISDDSDEFAEVIDAIQKLLKSDVNKIRKHVVDEQNTNMWTEKKDIPPEVTEKDRTRGKLAIIIAIILATIATAIFSGPVSEPEKKVFFINEIFFVGFAIWILTFGNVYAGIGRVRESSFGIILYWLTSISVFIMYLKIQNVILSFKHPLLISIVSCIAFFILSAFAYSKEKQHFLLKYFQLEFLSLGMAAIMLGIIVICDLIFVRFLGWYGVIGLLTGIANILCFICVLVSVIAIKEHSDME